MNILKLVARNLLRRKGRFMFTLLGITIGMAAFVALLAIGGNMRNEVTAQTYALGGGFVIVPDDLCVYNQIGIITGEAISERLAYGEYEAIAAIDGITVIPHLTRRMMIYNPTAGENQAVPVTGQLPAETQAFYGWEMSEGRYFESQDEEAVIIGQSIKNRFKVEVGDKLPIKSGIELEVIGVLKVTDGNDDAMVHMPISVAQRVFDREDSLSYMTARVDDMRKFDDYQEQMLNAANNIKIATNEQMLGSVLMILGSVEFTLQMVAGVALVAAAFGIINTMMTAVYERRREIGIMQALGSKSRTIFATFVLESGLYGLFGGALGVCVGYVSSLVIAPMVAEHSETMLKGMELGAKVDVQLVVTTIAFSLIISVLSGLYPAWKASKLTPVEAISNG
ncbi:MAG: ABC transporter permease [Oscillospiraceae bacterium]|nr:ABC transporter permease [Oscillospiraceae bacterium]